MALRLRPNSRLQVRLPSNLSVPPFSYLSNRNPLTTNEIDVSKQRRNFLIYRPCRVNEISGGGSAGTKILWVIRIGSMGKPISNAVGDGLGVPVKCHRRDVCSSANLSDARLFRRRFCFARSSLLDVWRFGFMHGMFAAAVGSAGFAVECLLICTDRPVPPLPAAS